MGEILAYPTTRKRPYPCCADWADAPRPANVVDFWETLVIRGQHISMGRNGITARWIAVKRLQERASANPDEFVPLEGAEKFDGASLQEIARAQANTLTFASAINQKTQGDLRDSLHALREREPASFLALTDGLETAQAAFAAVADFLQEAIRRVDFIKDGRRA